MIKNRRYNDLNTYFKNLYGHRVHKITVDAGFSCPNRDGSISTTGCIYCNAKGSGTAAHLKGLSITQQILNGEKAVAKRYKAKKFIAYFQSYTNTYADVSTLKKIYDEAVNIEDIIGLSIGTRPDCVDDDKLNLLEKYAANRLVWIEYGLQSSHDRTLALINRGHDFKCFENAIAATKNRGIKICAHVILGLPGETREDMLETARIIADLRIDGVKLHLLYVIKGTPLESLYSKGGYRCLEQDEYTEIVCDFLEKLPPDMLIQRLSSDPHPHELAAPQWALKKKENLDLIQSKLEQRDSRQGQRFGKGCVSL